MNQKVDNYLETGCGRCPLGGTPDCKVHHWTEELRLLRKVVLETGLKEELKWSVPCYTHNGKNVLLISALKDCSTISFFKGSLLEDPSKHLEKPGENSQAARYLKFTSVESIKSSTAVIQSLIMQAIAVEDSDKKVHFKKELDPFPSELESKFEEMPKLAEAFESLTVGRKRGYLLHFNQAKQAQTRITRIEKSIDRIMKGKGLHDCICGHSRRMPRCDGSHKEFNDTN